MEKQAKIQWSQIVELPTDCLIPFKNHPFKVVTDYQMIQLTESIRECGILTPLIVRPEVNGKYEIISGHRRKHAAEQLGMTMVPAIIRNGKYTEAVVEMVDSNLHREMILPSEKAYAYKMKYEALRVHGKKVRRSHVDENGEPLIGMRAVDIVGKDIGESPKQLQRYIKLTNLIPELMEKLDDGIISFNPAVEIAYLPSRQQEQLLDAMDYAQAVPSLSQAQRIKKLSQAGTLTLIDMQNILSEVKKGDVERVSFKSCQLRRFFPKDWSPERMKREILTILREYMELDYEKKNGGKGNV